MNCRGDEDIDAKRSRPSIGKPVMGHARKERVVLFGTDQRITSGPAAKRPHSKAEYMTAPERFADSQIPLAPRAPSIHDLAALGENLFSAKARQLRTAGPWWAIAGCAFIVSGAVAAALSRLPLPWRRHRLLRWVAGALILLLLAHIGHSVGAAAEMGPGVTAAARLAALAIAALMALLGAYLTARR